MERQKFPAMKPNYTTTVSSIRTPGDPLLKGSTGSPDPTIRKAMERLSELVVEIVLCSHGLDQRFQFVDKEYFLDTSQGTQRVSSWTIGR